MKSNSKEIIRLVNSNVSTSHLDWCGRERDIDEITLLLGITVGSVNSTLARAIRKMEGLLNDYIKE